MSEPVYTKFLPVIEDALREHYDITLAQSPSGLREMVAYHMGWQEPGLQGKRIRPALILLVVDACGRDWIHALPAAVAVEYLHNFSLIHDDIQDGSRQRHGRDALWTRWGIPQAINTGDAMFTLAYLALLNSRDFYADEIVAQLVAVFSQTCLKLTEGQHLDMLFEKQDNLTESDYLGMTGGKTAALLGCCTAIGGILGAMTLRQVEALKTFGVNLGLAFQVQDDLLGIWGEQKKTGKSANSDLAGSKKTLPILHAMNVSPSFKAAWQADHTSDQGIATLRKLLDQTDSRAYAQSLVKEYTQSALAALDEAAAGFKTADAEAPMPSSMNNLKALAAQLLDRDL
jgi:geranylgeranyl diphosphate synthase type I